MTIVVLVAAVVLSATVATTAMGIVAIVPAAAFVRGSVVVPIVAESVSLVSRLPAEMNSY